MQAFYLDGTQTFALERNSISFLKLLKKTRRKSSVVQPCSLITSQYFSQEVLMLSSSFRNYAGWSASTTMLEKLSLSCKDKRITYSLILLDSWPLLLPRFHSILCRLNQIMELYYVQEWCLGVGRSTLVHLSQKITRPKAREAPAYSSLGSSQGQCLPGRASSPRNTKSSPENGMAL